MRTVVYISISGRIPAFLDLKTGKFCSLRRISVISGDRSQKGAPLRDCVSAITRGPCNPVHQIVRNRFQSVESFCAIGHCLRAQAELPEYAEDHLPVGGIILGDQNSPLEIGSRPAFQF